MPNASVNSGAVRSSLTIDVPRLLAAAPIISVSDELERHVEDLRRLGVPVAVAQHACVRRHVEEARYRRRQPRKPSRLCPGVDGLHVAVQVERPVVGCFEGHTGSEVFSLTR